ncbi:MAG: hypothetical protein ACRDXB_00290 [Actinomycetes bacterium]
MVIEKDGEQHRVEELPWSSMLAALSRAPHTERTWEFDQTFVGQTYPLDEEDHLLLHRVKDPGEWLARIDLRTGAVEDLESGASQGFLETTAMCFTGFGNVLGMMQGSTSAPSHKSLQNWINGLKLFEERIVVRPLLSRAEIERLQTAEGASRVEIRLGSSQSAALAQKQGRLARFLRHAREEYGDIRVTMVISIPRGKGRSEDRQKLLDDLRDMQEIMPEAADVAKARLVYAEADGDEYSRLAEFVEHHITAKAKVPAVDDEGRSIRIPSAVRVILNQAEAHSAELRLAADVE